MTFHRDVEGGREALRQILDGPIRFTVDGSGYRLEGRTRAVALISPPTGATMASPAGFELRGVIRMNVASPRVIELLTVV